MAENLGNIYAELRLSLNQFKKDMAEAKTEIKTAQTEVNKQFDSLAQAGSKMKSAGSAMSRYVTAPILAMGTASVYAGAKFDSAMSEVMAISGATGDAFQQLQNQARDLGGTTKFTATEAASGMTMLARAGFDASEIMSAIPGMLDLAAAGNLELASAADIVSDTMMAFGESADQAGRYADVFAKAAASGNTTVEGLGQAMSYGAASAAAMGMGVETAAAVMTAFADAGIKSTRAGSTFEAVMRDLRKSAIEGGGALRYATQAGNEVSIAWYDAQGKARPFLDVLGDLEKSLAGASTAERDFAMQQLVQSRGMRGMNILLTRGSESLGQLEDSLYGAGGAAKEMSDTMLDNLAGSMVLLKSAVSEIMLSFADVLEPVVRKLADGLQKLAVWFGNLSKPIKTAIVVVLGIIAAIGPLLLIVGAFLTALPSMAAGWATVTAAASAAGPAIAAITGPIGLVIAGIVALVAGIRHLWKTNEAFRTKVTQIWGQIKDIITMVLTVIKDLVSAVWKQIKAVWDRYSDAIHKVTDTVWQAVLGSISGALDVIQGVLKVFIGLFTGDWEKMSEGLKQIWAGLWQAITATLGGAWTLLSSAFMALWNNISSWFTKLVTWAKTWGSDLVKGLWKGISSMASWIGSKVKDFASGIADGFKNFFGIHSPSTLMAEYGVNLGAGLAEGIADSESMVLSEMQDLATSLRSEIDQSISQMNTLGDALTTALSAQYSEMERMQTSALDRRISEERRASNEILAIYDQEYAEKLKVIDEEAYNQIKALQDQIDGIDDLTKAENKAREEEAHISKVTELEKKINAAKSAEERERLLKELSSTIADYERKQLLEQRRAQQESLRDQIAEIRTAADEKRKILKEETNAKKEAERERLASVEEGLSDEKTAIRNHYAELKSSENLFLEARKLMLSKNSDEMIALLEEYNPRWQDAGQSMGESLAYGLNSEKKSIQDAILESIGMLDMVGQKTQELADIEKQIQGMQSADAARLAGTDTGTVDTPDLRGMLDIDMDGAATEIAKAKDEAIQFTSTYKDGLVPAIQNVADALDESKSSWDEAKGSISAAADAVGTNMTDGWADLTAQASELGTSLSNTWTSIKETTELKWGEIKTYLAETVPVLVEDVGAWFSALPGKVSEGLSNFGTTVQTGLETGVQSLHSLFFENIPYWVGFGLGSLVRITKESVEEAGTFFSELPGKITGFLTEAGEVIESTWTEAKEVMTANASKAIDATVSFFSKLPGRLTTWLQTLLTTITTKFIAMKNAIVFWVSTALTTVVQYFQELPARIWTWLVQTANKITEFGTLAWQKATEAGQRIVDGVMNKIRDLPSKVSKILSNIGGSVKDAGSNLLNSAKSAGDHIWTGFKDGLGIHSPSYLEKAMFNIMDTSDDLLQGMKSDFRTLGAIKVKPPSLTGYSKSLQKDLAYVNGMMGDTDSGTYDFGSNVTKEEKVVHEHTGTLEVKGVNNKGETVETVKIIMDELRRETRS